MNVVIDEKSGGLAFWDGVRDCPRSTVLGAAQKAGIAHLVPAAPPVSTTLRDAMEHVATDMFGKRKHEPITTLQTAAPRTFECVRYVRGSDQNDHRFLFSATIDINGDCMVCRCNNGHYVEDDGSREMLADIRRALQDEVDSRMQMLPGPVITRIITLAMRDWGAQILKAERGGLWFIPASCRQDYMQWCLALQSSGCAFTLCDVDVSRNPMFINRLLDELSSEVLQSVQEIQQEMMAGSAMQDRSLTLRISKAQSYLDKITQYESITGRTLTDLRGCVEGVKSALAMQKMMAASV